MEKHVRVGVALASNWKANKNVRSLKKTNNKTSVASIKINAIRFWLYSPQDVTQAASNDLQARPG